MDHGQEYQGRSRRLPWLIRPFIDPEAEFLFVEEERLLETAAGEQAVPFDAPKLAAVKLNHRGDRCTLTARHCRRFGGNARTRLRAS